MSERSVVGEERVIGLESRRMRNAAFGPGWGFIQSTSGARRTAHGVSAELLGVVGGFACCLPFLSVPVISLLTL